MEKPANAIAEAVALAGAGRLGESLRTIDKALDAAPGDLDLLFARASTLFGWARYAEARAVLLRAEQLGLRSGALYSKLGWACFWLGRAEDAAEAMRKAAVAQPDEWETHFGLATALYAQKRTDESRAEFERALSLNAESLHCISNLVECEVDLGRLDVAEAYARRAIESNRESAVAWCNLGFVLDSQERYAEAVAAFERSEELEGVTDEAPDEFVRFGTCLLRAARTREAIALLDRKLPRHPSVGLHSHYALALLTSGRLTEGWEHYEVRWLEPPLRSTRPNFLKPAWAGQDLRGKAILLRAEQGHGDFIQFIRYASHIKALGATVLLQPRDEMRTLAEGLPEIGRILMPNTPYPPFDFYINLLSIPRVFGTDLSSIPADTPYLRADPDRTAKWAGRFDDDRMLKVGVVWAGSPGHVGDRFRSLPLSRLAPFMEVEGARFYSLQKGPAAGDLATASPNLSLVDLGSDLQDFADTAAAISKLDLVIGVDTAVVHLAGALGKLVWTLLPIPADWRWLEEREDSPWYPTMRLFRQHQQGDWGEVIDRVKHALEIEVRKERPKPSAKTSAEVPRKAAIALKPTVRSIPRSIPALCRVAETRVGIVQYFPDQPWIGKSIEWYGEYLQPQLELLSRLVTPGSIAMEVGAGVGLHALSLASTIGSAGHLFLYEDDDLIKRVLRQNLSSNQVANFTVMKHSLGRPANVESVPIQKSPIDTIDDLQLEMLHCLKLNAGLRALDILAGAENTLWRLRPKLFIAAADEEALAQLDPFVRDFGYRCFRMETPLFNRTNFNQRETDIFSGRTALAVLAIPEEIDLDVKLDGCVPLM